MKKLKIIGLLLISHLFFLKIFYCDFKMLNEQLLVTGAKQVL